MKENEVITERIVKYTTHKTIRRQCKVCDGFMVINYEGGVMMSNPAKYAHYCDKCNTRENLSTQYPYTEWEYVYMDDPSTN